jgi:hypothetical protein
LEGDCRKTGRIRSAQDASAIYVIGEPGLIMGTGLDVFEQERLTNVVNKGKWHWRTGYNLIVAKRPNTWGQRQPNWEVNT